MLSSKRTSSDAENRLISLSGSASETYVYDAIGRRVKRNYSGTSLSYYYDLEGHAVAMFGPSDQYLTGEMFLGNMHLATHSNGRTYFSHTNLVGSTRVTTDETGAVYNNCNWWPFGDQQSCTAWPVTDIGYAGYEHDQQTGLDHTWFRYYNPRLGRWMSADPLGGSIGNPQSLNRFAYVLNNPSNLIDSDGLGPCLPGYRPRLDPQTGKTICVPNVFNPDCMFDGYCDERHAPGPAGGCDVTFGLLTMHYTACPVSGNSPFRDQYPRGRGDHDCRIETCIGPPPPKKVSAEPKPGVVTFLDALLDSIGCILTGGTIAPLDQEVVPQDSGDSTDPKNLYAGGRQLNSQAKADGVNASAGLAEYLKNSANCSNEKQKADARSRAH